MSYHYLLKFLLVGDSSVGKSCLLIQYIDKKFIDSHEATIGVEFGCKTIVADNCQLRLQIWDTAGQEVFRSVTNSFYRGACVMMLVYDITNKRSFENIPIWLDEAKRHCHRDIVVVIIGNKCDLNNNRAVSYEDGLAYAKENNFIFVESSARTQNNNINEAFQLAAQSVLEKIKNKTFDLEQGDQSHGIKFSGDILKSKRLSQPIKTKTKSNCC